MTQGGRRRVGALWEGSLTVHLPLRKAQGDVGEGIYVCRKIQSPPIYLIDTS